MDVMASVQPPMWVLVVVEGADLGRQLCLREPLVSVGRGRDDDFLLQDIGVTRRQLVIEWDQPSGRHFVVQVGDSFTAINNIPVTRNAGVRHELMEGDQLQIGSTVLRYVQQTVD
jgi:pSer/pThr/pTyr-binding forkhead associated (FHA) protein